MIAIIIGYIAGFFPVFFLFPKYGKFTKQKM